MLKPFEEHALIEIDSIFTFYHFQFATGFVFKGEKHPFWELVYINNGQVDIGADDKVYSLGAGDIIFHRPDEFHSIWANYAHAPDLIVISFACNSPAMQNFEQRRFHVNAHQNALLQNLLSAAGDVFSTPLNIHPKILNPKNPGGVYILRLLLTQLLMDMLPYAHVDHSIAPPHAPHPDESTTEMIDSIINYMRENLHGELCFDDVCRKVGMSATAVKQLFRRYFGMSAMAFYEHVRMGEARQLLRERQGDIASVAYELGFSSPSYFSTRFKRVNGVSPREYVRDILSVQSNVNL